MTRKALAALDWIAKHCSRAAYYVKVDDDAFVNQFALLRHLRDIHAARYRRRLLMCLVWERPVVARRGKWAVTTAEFAGRRYPTYCCGLGYVITGDVIVLLLAAATCTDQTDHTDAADDHLHRNITPSNDNVTGDVVSHPPLYSDVTSGDDVSVNGANGHDKHESSNIDVSNDVTARRRFWIDDVYVTGLLVEALGGRIQHTNMTAAYCKSDKMAAVYRHVTEWYKYVFTQVGDNETLLYTDTWNALRQRATSTRTAVPSPSVIRPGRLADHYIPLSTMLQLAKHTA